MGRLVRDSWLIFRRSAREARRQAAVAFVAPTMVTLIIVLTFQAIYGDIADVTGFPTDRFIEWIAPAAAFLSVFVGAGFTAASLIRDIQSGYLERLRLLPAHPAAPIVGRAAFDGVRAIPPAAAVLSVALALGATNESGPLGLLGVVALAALLGIGWNGIFYAAVLKTRNPAVIQGLQPVTFMPAVMFSSFLVPEAFMPGWYAAIATHNPVTPVIDAGRSILLGGVAWGDVAVALAAIGGIGAITFLAAGREFARLLRTS